MPLPPSRGRGDHQENTAELIPGGYAFNVFIHLCRLGQHDILATSCVRGIPSRALLEDEARAR
ncbi:MAG: hypothetical protein NWE79_05820 [Candidatus Bathyarchaeota archaeon]|nr:hypothetical protein [Candidatus Bathyarchaeota archaeon]